MRLRAEPEDFRVEEVPLYAPAGEGEHTFVWLEKRLRTTEALLAADDDAKLMPERER